MEMEEGEVWWIWKDYFEVLYNIDTQKEVVVHMCGFNGIKKDNYFRVAEGSN